MVQYCSCNYISHGLDSHCKEPQHKPIQVVAQDAAGCLPPATTWMHGLWKGPGRINGQYKGLAPMHEYVPPTALPPVIPTLVASIPVICHSTHVSIPTQAIRESHASEKAIQDAHAAGEVWEDN